MENSQIVGKMESQINGVFSDITRYCVDEKQVCGREGGIVDRTGNFGRK